MRKTAKSLWISVMALLLCFSMLLGTTYAWFTDTVESGNNVIIAGNLDVEMYWSKDLSSGNWINAEDANAEPIFNHDKWEPGYTEVRYVKIVNAGNLALKYGLSIIPDGEVSILADVIDVYYVENATENIADRNLTGLTSRGTLRDAIIGKIPVNGVLLPNGKTPANGQYAGEVVIAIALQMDKYAGNEYMNKSIGDSFSIQLVASQYNYESDSFDPDYDSGVELPAPIVDSSVSTNVTPDADNKVPAGGATLDGGSISANVPAGVQMEQGATSLTLSVSNIENSNANITLGENEVQSSIDVHMAGVATGNSVPMEITLLAVAAKGMNLGNLKLYHVENGVTNEMTYVAQDAAFTAHNQFKYDPATGDIILYMATFSEIAVVADTVNPWEGNFNYTWYDVDAKELTIANADQLAAFGAIVGGMAEGIEQDSFSGKTVKLVADINLGDKESENNPDIIFYPIGYNSDDGKYEKTGVAVSTGFYAFEGTFDGNGNTIENFYQNTWEMKGDHDWYDATLQYYRDGMGLFGKVYGGTVKNLTVSNFSSDGEIATTGVIAAYADGATFENIAIFDCNPRVYNIGNGGIVGCVGWYAKDAGLKTTFTNITVDNSNKISALWGSYDVACGGIVGQYYPTSGQSAAEYPVNAGIHFENCHVSAQMDVYNDVCANYQYYAYRYTGMLIGSIRENETIDGHVYPKMNGITASGCTVHFGDWNDYYYCELVANTTASYTHDHQMSRLEQVASVDVANLKYLPLGVEDTAENWVAIPSGRVNYVVVKEKDTETGMWIHGDGSNYATCYHFVDGTVWNHEDAGYHNGENGEKFIDENGDGAADLKEDKQLIYREFNQLFTGYGWGVTSKGLTDYEGVENMDITQGDHEDSVDKFTNTGVTELPNNIAISIGDLFAAIADSGVEIKSGSLMVSVEDLDNSDGIISAVFKRDINNWQDSTITISGTGRAKITIQDYYFCTPTSFEVEIVEASEYDMFSLVFPNVNDYLYRVGNQNTVALGSLFSTVLDKTVTANKATVTVTPVAGDANDVYTVNETDWTKSTIKFTGTGVVTVTINVGDTKELTLNLEVVNATNVVENGKISNYGTSSVLLGNTTVSTLYLNGGATLYGNGFTIDCTNSPINGSGSVSENYIIALVDAHLDNVQVIGKVYTEYGAQASNDYNRALVVTKGNSTVTNCYLSNTASPIRMVEGSLYVKGTTVKGGNFANIDVRNGHLTVEDVTTINQAIGNDVADDKSTVIGLGIVVYYENVDPALTSVTIKGTLTQYNHISSNDKFSHEYATQLVDQMMTGDYAEYRIEIDGVKWVNSGIIAMTDGVIPVDERTDKCGYTGKEVSFVAKDGYIYSAKPSEASVKERLNDYVTIGQGAIAPTYSFDYTNKNNIAKTDDSNDYCYYENGKVLIAMDQGDTFNWDPFILTATKLGNTLDYTVTMNGTTYAAGEKIAFNTSGDYVVTYTYTDVYNYTVDAEGNLITVPQIYTKTVNISVSVIKPKAQHATFTFADTNTATEKLTVNNNTYISATGVSATDKEWGYITVNGTKIFYPITEAQMKKNMLGNEVQVYYYVFNDAVTITDYKDGGTGGINTYNSETTTMPSNLTVVNGMEAKYTDVNSACVDISKLTKDGPSGEVWDFSASTTVSGTTVYNGYLAHSSPSGLAIKSGTRDYDAITVAQFSYTDAAGATYYYFVGYYMPNQVSSDSGGECVTPDTLVTLADGTQVRVDSLTGNEELLVWNMETGKLDKAPIMFVDSDAEAEYEIIHLYFSDGTDVKVIYEHGFWDYDLNKYVYLDKNAADYIGHTFAKQNGDSLEKVQLVDVVIETETTTAWSPVTAEHLCYFVNGMLSMPGGVGGLFNIFEVDPETMTYDFEAMQKDIETYGLYTYEELNAICPLSEEMFNAAGGAYLKISIGKGNLTIDELIYMINRYSNFFE